jgi:anti-sigma B factor antagonist
VAAALSAAQRLRSIPPSTVMADRLPGTSDEETIRTMSRPSGFRPEEIFQIDEREQDGRTVLALSGELDFGTADAVQRRLGELRDARRPVLLDLDRLTFMDSTGIRLVLTACDDASGSGWEFRVTRGSEHVRRVLEAARVIDRLPYDDRGGG